MYTLYIGLGGALFAALLVIPPWPMYKRNPLKFHPVGAQDQGSEIKKEQ